MQELWAKLLAGEANSPGSYSKRTINLLGSLDKTDALLFKTICGFSWYTDRVAPLVYDYNAPIYKNYGIDFRALEHLDDIGLINFFSSGSYTISGMPKFINIFYYDTPIDIEFPCEQSNTFNLGMARLTRIGEELAPVCNSEYTHGFLEYILGYWQDTGLIVSSPYPPYQSS